jgi:hypothetical protein
MIDREEAHRRLDELLDLLDRQELATSRERIDLSRSVRDGVAEFLRSAFGACFAEARAADTLPDADEVIASLSPADLRRSGSTEWTFADLMDLAEQQSPELLYIRRAIASDALWGEKAGAFQPGVGVALAAVALAVNAGGRDELQWLIPHGADKAATADAVKAFAGEVYYRSGYEDRRLHLVWNDLIETQLKIGLTFGTFQRRRLNGDADLKAFCQGMKSKGEEDRWRGQPMNSPIPATWDRMELRAMLLRMQG